MLRPLAPLALLLAVGLGGCGDDEPDGPPESPTGTATPAGATADAVIAEVSSVAPTLESFYRGGPYPQDVADVVESLAPAGVTLSPGTGVGGYVYDPDAVEFTLCLEDTDGAWASYDTAPMGVRDSGTEGGCPNG